MQIRDYMRLHIVQRCPRIVLRFTMKFYFPCFATLILSGASCFVNGCLDTVLVPAYGNPCCDGGPEMWSSLTSTAMTSNLNIIAILNPSSGPGNGPEIEANYINDAAAYPRKKPLVDFTAAGGIAVGYVFTLRGDRDMALVKADVDLYFNPSYYKEFPVQVSGIFFDEMSNDLGKVGYYQELYDYVKMKDPNAKVISNPGTSFTFNESNADGFSPLKTMDSSIVPTTFLLLGSMTFLQVTLVILCIVKHYWQICKET